MLINLTCRILSCVSFYSVCICTARTVYFIENDIKRFGSLYFKTNKIIADRKVSECAVSLYWLYDFVAKRQSDLNDLCTQDVVTQIIMPETQTANCRYVDLLPDSYVSTPTYFACHVWTAPFLDLVNSFRQFFNEDLEECKGIYIWIDIFAINQNVPGNLNEDLKVLPTIIQNAAKGTLICLDVDNTLLTR